MRTGVSLILPLTEPFFALQISSAYVEFAIALLPRVFCLYGLCGWLSSSARFSLWCLSNRAKGVFAALLGRTGANVERTIPILGLRGILPHHTGIISWKGHAIRGTLICRASGSLAIAQPYGEE
jgi:hypothetical protein